MLLIFLSLSLSHPGPYPAASPQFSIRPTGLFPQIHNINKSSVKDICQFWSLPPPPHPQFGDSLYAQKSWLLRFKSHCNVLPQIWCLSEDQHSHSDTAGQSIRAEPLQTFIILFAHYKEWHFTMMAFLCYSFCSHRCRLPVLMVCNRILLQKMTIWVQKYILVCHSTASPLAPRYLEIRAKNWKAGQDNV